MKKLHYCFSLTVIASTLFVCGFLFYIDEKHLSDNQATISIKPFTVIEKKEIINAQEQEEAAKPTGPLIAFITAPEAEKKVLYPMETKIRAS